MNLPTQPYKGARDFYPEDKRIQKYMFNSLRKVAESFGYQEYDAPIIEPMELYLSKSSEEIVAEQTYSFTDRGGRNVTIRPEMTPTVSRMVAGRRQELAYPLRLYSLPNLWRYERPQAGRLREHWQLNIDIFGAAGIEADHEVILVANSIFREFGAKAEFYEIRVSSRKVVDDFLQIELGLEDSQVKEALRLIDRMAKVKEEDFHSDAQRILKDTNKTERFSDVFLRKNKLSLDSELLKSDSGASLQKLFNSLHTSGIDNAVIDLSVVRGFDYYTDIVFEVFDTDPDNNRSMAGGGRYDGLVGLFGVDPVPTVGFAMGDVTLQKFLEAHKLLPKLAPETDAVVIFIGDVYHKSQAVLSELRAKGAKLAADATGRKLDAQIKSAVKSGVRYAIFIGEKELDSGKFKLRDLEKGEEKELSLDQIASTLSLRHDA